MGNRSLKKEDYKVNKMHLKVKTHTYNGEDLGYEGDNDSPIKKPKQSIYLFNPNSNTHICRFNRHFASIKSH